MNLLVKRSKQLFDRADVQKNGHLYEDESKNAIGYLNLRLASRRIVENEHDICLAS
jgi:hypothetical protein